MSLPGYDAWKTSGPPSPRNPPHEEGARVVFLRGILADLDGAENNIVTVIVKAEDCPRSFGGEDYADTAASFIRHAKVKVARLLSDAIEEDEEDDA